jgi:iodotyrosine deiodinase
MAMKGAKFIPLPDYREYPLEEMVNRSAGFCAEMRRRRTVRQFSDRPVPREILEQCIRAAASGPSGANLQPWHFVIISDPDIKRRIRVEAEANERRLYRERAPEKWLDKLKRLGTDENKPFLETAPYLIVIFLQRYGVSPAHHMVKNYYALESVGIATGILIAALHHAGLVMVTYTPSPMLFLNDILGRPTNERPFLVLPVGYPSEDVVVPDLPKKPLEEVATFV